MEFPVAMYLKIQIGLKLKLLNKFNQYKIYLK